jgi:hypothetical protein
MDKQRVLKAKARFGFGNRVIVDNCPYCNGKHVHGYRSDLQQRAADCGRGEYILDFSDDEAEGSDGKVQ